MENNTTTRLLAEYERHLSIAKKHEEAANRIEQALEEDRARLAGEKTLSIAQIYKDFIEVYKNG